MSGIVDSLFELAGYLFLAFLVLWALYSIWHLTYKSFLNDFLEEEKKEKEITEIDLIHHKFDYVVITTFFYIQLTGTCLIIFFLIVQIGHKSAWWFLGAIPVLFTSFFWFTIKLDELVRNTIWKIMYPRKAKKKKAIPVPKVDN